MTKNLVESKSKQFAIRIVNLYRYIVDEKQEYVLSKQLLRSGTSIGANIAEAQYGKSKSDFLSKMTISMKEAAENVYWLDILHDTKYITDREYQSIMYDCQEILKLLTAITKTVKKV